MTEVQIAILAREYAEWMIKDAKAEDLPNCLKRTMLASNTEYAGEVFHWLLNRYYIVEKHKVEEEYNLALSEFEKAGTSRPLHQSYFDGRGDAIKSLFPGIAKEVEE